MGWSNAQLWVDLHKDAFCKQITTFLDAITNRILPTFDQIESEAKIAAEREWERLGNLPSSEDSDGSYAAEQAQEVGINYYIAMVAVHQTVINLTAVAMNHMFEQSASLFCKEMRLNFPNDKSLTFLGKFNKCIASQGIILEKSSACPKIEELRHLANVIKHAEGRSAKKLRKLRPDLFEHPGLRKYPFFDFEIRDTQISFPLAGKDIYPTIDDLQAYCSALVSFWQELSNPV